MKYRHHLLRIVFFVAIFLMMDYKYISGYRAFDNYDVLSTYIMSTSVGYNNLFLIVGMVVTGLFVSGLNNVFIESPISIIKYGKKRFYRKNVTKTLKDSLFISIEYIGVTVAFCLKFFNINLLLDSGFFFCVILYTIMMWIYFSVVGLTTYIMKILLDSKKIYVFISGGIFFLLAGAKYISIEISPVYFSSFIDDWFASGYFNVFSYLLCFVKGVLANTLLFLTGAYIIEKKDFLNEQI